MSKLLIIDDEDDFRETLAKRFKFRGYDVLSMASGKDIKKVLESNKDLDVIILDLKMPDMNGEEVLKLIKDIKKEVQVIILTGHGSTESAVRMTRMDAFTYLQKPVPLEKLIDVVEQAKTKVRLLMGEKAPAEAPKKFRFAIIPIFAKIGITPQTSTNLSKFFTILIPLAASAGGFGTVLGGGRNPMALELLKRETGIHISFLDWILYQFPMVFLASMGVWAVCYIFMNPKIKTFPDQIKAEKLPPMSRNEKMVSGIFILAFVFWTLSDFTGLHLSVIAAVALCLPILFPMAEGLHLSVSNVALMMPVTTSFVMLVIGCPPTIIAYSAGYFKQTDFMRVAIPLVILVVMLLTVVKLIYWPLVGFA